MALLRDAKVKSQSFFPSTPVDLKKSWCKLSTYLGITFIESHRERVKRSPLNNFCYSSSFLLDSARHSSLSIGHSIPIVAFQPALGRLHPFSSSLASNLEQFLCDL